jgi:CRP/FNR family cyclic AMP-dependent transcriptional regulator
MMTSNRLKSEGLLAFPREISGNNLEEHFRKRAVIFSQGDPADAVLSIRRGVVKLSADRRNGKRAVVRILQAGAVFGEECLMKRGLRNASAAAIESSTIVRIPRAILLRAIQSDGQFAERFIGHLTARIHALEGELIDHRTDSSEELLAKTLLKLACDGSRSTGGVIEHTIDQLTLAEIVGTTRSRVSFFMNRFRRLGLIDYDDSLHVYPTLAAFLNEK